MDKREHHGPHGPHGPHGAGRKPRNVRGTLRKLLGYLEQYRLHLAAVVVLLIVSSACTVGGSYLIKPLINDYILTGDFPGLARMLAVMGGGYLLGAMPGSWSTCLRTRWQSFGEICSIGCRACL